MGQKDSRSTEPTAYERACARVRAGPLLTESVERSLTLRWQAGDQAAGHELVRLHLPIVLKLARRYRGYGLPREELIAEGNVGLMRALEKFELRGVRFKTYATYWVRAHMLALVLHSTSLVTRGTGAVGAKFFFRLRSARARLETLHGAGAEGIDEALAQQFGVTVAQVKAHTAQLAAADQSLDVPMADDAESTWLDLLPCERPTPEAAADELERSQTVHDVVRRVWRTFDARERAVVEARLLSDDADTLAELGARFSLSRERLRQIEIKVKARLAHELQECVAG